MVRLCLMLFFIGLSANAQQLELKIETIEVDDEEAHERKFTVRYTLENLTDTTLLFFQDLDGMVPSTGGASTCKPYFKVFEEDKLIERNVFNGWNTPVSVPHSDARKTLLSESQKAFLIENPKSILANLQSINPNEKRFFQQVFYWDRKRYYSDHDIEYYLDEKTSYFFEITMVMVREQYKNEMPIELYRQISTDNRFVIGLFTTNKHRIDFGIQK